MSIEGHVCLVAPRDPRVFLTGWYSRLPVIDVRADQESEGLSVEVISAVGDC